MLKLITYSILFSVIFLWPSKAGVADGNESSVPAECKSYISIQGSSNVNRFRLYNESPKVKTTPENITEGNHIRIPVYDFEASNHRMLSDFYEMVKASKYPFIDIDIEPRGMADFDEQSGLTNFRTTVTIAGKSNTYVVPSAISGCQQRGFMLEGDLEVKLTDFDIQPPTKLLGAIKVNDNVFIKFAFRMEHEKQLSEKLVE